MQFGIQSWIRVAALVVELDHFFKCLEAAVVHVGSRPRDLAQRGRLEVPLSRAFVGEFSVPPRYSRIVQFLVREVRAYMTGSTVAPAAEDLKAGLLLGGERRS